MVPDLKLRPIDNSVYAPDRNLEFSNGSLCYFERVLVDRRNFVVKQKSSLIRPFALRVLVLRRRKQFK